MHEYAYIHALFIYRCIQQLMYIQIDIWIQLFALSVDIKMSL